MIDDIAFLDDSTRPSAPAIPDATPQHRAHGRRLVTVSPLPSATDGCDPASAGGPWSGVRVTRRRSAEPVSNMEMIENYRRVGTHCGP